MMNSQATNPLALRSFEGLPNNGDPFLDCRLDREKYAEILTKIVLTYHRGFVLALSSDWGTGKTFFVKRWKKYLEHKEIQSIYFNAWENDFDNNALIALLAELQSVVLDQNRELYEKLIEKTSLIVKRILPTTIKLFSKILLRGEDISEILKELTAASLTTTSDSINDYIQKKKDIQDFKDALSAFVQSTNQDKPLVIFIDELDRCRPDYAVEVLEAVKHLFNIDGIVFVLSIDKKHLASSIKGYYGSEHINTDEYLRRFIDLEYTLPEPFIASFASSLFKKHHIAPNSIIPHSFDSLSVILELYKHILNPTLRQIEKIIIQMVLSFKSLGIEYHKYSEALILLLFIKMFNRDLYDEIKQGKFTTDIIGVKIFDFLFKSNTLDGSNTAFLEGLFLLLWMYNNTQTDCADVQFTISEDARNYGTLYNTYRGSEKKINFYFNKFRERYKDCFDDPRHHPTSARLINHIELLDNFS